MRCSFSTLIPLGSIVNVRGLGDVGRPAGSGQCWQSTTNSGLFPRSTSLACAVYGAASWPARRAHSTSKLSAQSARGCYEPASPPPAARWPSICAARRLRPAAKPLLPAQRPPARRATPVALTVKPRRPSTASSATSSSSAWPSTWLLLGAFLGSGAHRCGCRRRRGRQRRRRRRVAQGAEGAARGVEQQPAVHGALQEWSWRWWPRWRTVGAESRGSAAPPRPRARRAAAAPATAGGRRAEALPLAGATVERVEAPAAGSACS